MIDALLDPVRKMDLAGIADERLGAVVGFVTNHITPPGLRRCWQQRWNRLSSAVAANGFGEVVHSASFSGEFPLDGQDFRIPIGDFAGANELPLPLREFGG